MRTIKLKHPISIKADNGTEQKLNEITLCRVKVKHLKVMPKGMFESNPDAKGMNPYEFVPLIAGLARLSIENIDEVDLTDLMNIVEGVNELVGEFITQKSGIKKSTV